MSFRVFLEIIRAIVTVVLLSVLLVKGKPLAVARRKGYKLLLLGFSLIAFASVLDITDNFPSLDSFIIIGDTAYQAILEKVVGYLGGFLCITVGFWRWLPGVSELQKTQSELAVALQGEAELRQDLEVERNQLFTTLYSIGDGVISTDVHGKVCMINPAAEKMTGWSFDDAVGKDITEVFNIVNEETKEVVEPPVKKVLETGEIVGLANHTELIAKDGKRRTPIADSGAPVKNSEGDTVGVVLVFRDVSNERKQFDEKLKFQKLESVGILAGGIAHDFNNLLLGIQGNISLALFDKGISSNVKEKLGFAEKAAQRAAHLTQQLLTFSKGGYPNIEKVAIDEVIKEAASFIITGSGARCSFDIDKELWPAKCDKGQISQVVENLILNARQAMPDGGSIDIAVRNIDEKLAEELDLPSIDKYILIRIKDSGKGISKEELEHIFDPYFTTKDTGSGLGLATSFSIIKKHNGIIKVDSELGVGTTFNIYIHADCSDSEDQSSDSDLDRSAHISGVEDTLAHILIMDDELLIRTLLTAMLEELGYKVSSSQNGEEAIEIYKESMKNGEKIDLVMLDLTIPGGMGGEEAARRLLELDKDVKMVVASGYAESPVVANYKEFGFAAALPKPFGVENLAETLELLLS